jgi:trehalose 6-phosphate synthase
LSDALVINPYDTEQLADTIRQALELSPEDRRMRMQRMRAAVREHNVYRWAAKLIEELCQIRPAKALAAPAPATAPAPGPQLVPPAISRAS